MQEPVFLDAAFPVNPELGAVVVARHKVIAHHIITVPPAGFESFGAGNEGQMPFVTGARPIMIESFRLAYVMQRSVDVTVGPDPAWSWLEEGWNIVPEARNDEVTWSYDPMDPWHIAFTPSIYPLEVKVDGEVVFTDGKPTRVDGEEIRAKAREQAKRLHAKL